MPPVAIPEGWEVVPQSKIPDGWEEVPSEELPAAPETAPVGGLETLTPGSILGYTPDTAGLAAPPEQPEEPAILPSSRDSQNPFWNGDLGTLQESREKYDAHRREQATIQGAMEGSSPGRESLEFDWSPPEHPGAKALREIDEREEAARKAREKERATQFKAYQAHQKAEREAGIKAGQERAKKHGDRPSQFNRQESHDARKGLGDVPQEKRDKAWARKLYAIIEKNESFLLDDQWGDLRDQADEILRSEPSSPDPDHARDVERANFLAGFDDRQRYAPELIKEAKERARRAATHPTGDVDDLAAAKRVPPQLRDEYLREFHASIAAGRPAKQLGQVEKVGFSLQEAGSSLLRNTEESIEGLLGGETLNDGQKRFLKAIRDIRGGADPYTTGYWEGGFHGALKQSATMGASLTIGGRMAALAKAMRGGKLAVGAAQALGVGSVYYNQMYQDTYVSLLDADVDPKTAGRAAHVSAFLQAGVEGIVIPNPFGKRMGSAAVNKTIAGVVADNVKRFGGEFGEEALQGIIDTAIQEFTKDGDVDAKKSIEAGLRQAWESLPTLVFLLGPGQVTTGSVESYGLYLAEQRMKDRAAQEGQTPAQRKQELADAQLHRELGPDAIEGLARIPSSPGKKEWAAITGKPIKEAPNRATRREQHKRAKEYVERDAEAVEVTGSEPPLVSDTVPPVQPVVPPPVQPKPAPPKPATPKPKPQAVETEDLTGEFLPAETPYKPTPQPALPQEADIFEEPAPVEKPAPKPVPKSAGKKVETEAKKAEQTAPEATSPHEGKIIVVGQDDRRRPILETIELERGGGRKVQDSGKPLEQGEGEVVLATHERGRHGNYIPIDPKKLQMRREFIERAKPGVWFQQSWTPEESMILEDGRVIYGSRRYTGETIQTLANKIEEGDITAWDVEPPSWWKKPEAKPAQPVEKGDVAPTEQDAPATPLEQAGITVKKTDKGWVVTGLTKEQFDGIKQKGAKGKRATKTKPKEPGKPGDRSLGGGRFLFRGDPTDRITHIAEGVAEEASLAAAAESRGHRYTSVGEVREETAERLEQVEEFWRGEHEALVEKSSDREAARLAAREGTKLNSQDIHNMEEAGFGHGSDASKIAERLPAAGEKMRGFDGQARVLAKEFPGAFDSENVEESLWNLIRDEGTPVPTFEEFFDKNAEKELSEAAEEAADIIRQQEEGDTGFPWEQGGQSDYDELGDIIDSGDILAAGPPQVGEGVILPEGATLAEAVDSAELTPEYKVLWGILRPLLESQSKGMPRLFVKDEVSGGKAHGLYEPISHVIEVLQGLPAARMGRVLLHEAVHAATRNAVLVETAPYYHGDRDADVPQRSRDAVARLDFVTYWLDRQMAKDGLTLRDLGLGGRFDSLELIAEAFTNPKLQEFMAKHKVPRSTKFADLRGKTLFEAFMDFVQRILGFKKGTRAVNALEEVIGLSDTIMQEDTGGVEQVGVAPTQGRAVLSEKPRTASDIVADIIARNEFADLDALTEHMVGELGEARTKKLEGVLKAQWDKTQVPPVQPPPVQPDDDQLTGIKVRKLNEQADALGQPRPSPAEAIDVVEKMNEALARHTEESDEKIQGMASQIIQDGGETLVSLDDTADLGASVTYHYGKANDAEDRANRHRAEGNEQAARDADQDAENHLTAMNNAQQAVRIAAGRQFGYFGLLLQTVVDKDGEAHIERELRKANNGQQDLDENGNDLIKEKAKKTSKRIKKAKKKQAEAGHRVERGNATAAAEDVVDRLVGEIKGDKVKKRKKRATSNRIFTEEGKDEAIKRIRAIRKRAGTTASAIPAGPALELMKDASYVAGYFVESGALKLSDFTADMVAAVGDWVRPHLKDLHREARKAHAVNRKKEVRERLEDSEDVRGQHRSVAELAKEILAENAKEDGTFLELDPLLDILHPMLQEIDSDITRQEANDMLGAYGKWQEASKEDLDIAYSQRRGEARVEGQINDLEGERAPKKTGKGRPPKSDRERRRSKLVRFLKKQLERTGRYKEDEESGSRLKGSLESAETRLENEIADLDEQIRNRRKTVKKRSAELTSPEIESLKKQRAAKKEQLDAIEQMELEQWEGEGGALADTEHAAQLKAVNDYLKLLDSQIKRLKQQNLKKDVFPKPKPTRPGGKRVDARKDEIEALQAEREQIQLLLDPDYKDRKKLEAAERQVQRQIAKLEAEEAAGFKMKEKPATTPESPKLTEAKAKLAEIQERKRAALEEEYALRAARAQQKRSLAAISARIASGDYAPKTRKPARTFDDQEWRDGLLELNAAREQDAADRAKYEWDNMSRAESAWHFTKIGGMFMKAWLTMLDLGATGLQTGPAMSQHPIVWAKGLFSTVKAVSKTQREVMDARREAAEDYEAAKGYGLALSEHNKSTSVVHTEIVGTGPIIDNTPGVAVSERTFHTTMNEVRLGVFRVLRNAYTRDGRTLTQQRGEAIAFLVNSFTFGYVPNFKDGKRQANVQGAMQVSGAFVWAPSMYIARGMLGTFAPFYHPGADNRIRMMAATEYLKFIGGAAALTVASRIAYAMLHGEDDEEKFDEDGWREMLGEAISPDGLSPVDVNWWKGWGGNVHMDFTSAMAEVGTIYARIANSAVDYHSGEPLFETQGPLRQPREVIGNKASYKIAPWWNTAADVLGSRNVLNQPNSLANTAAQATVPLSVQSWVGAVDQVGLTEGSLLSIPGTTGRMLSSYNPDDPKSQATLAADIASVWRIFTGAPPPGLEEEDFDNWIEEKIQWDTDLSGASYLRPGQLKRAEEKREARKRAIVTGALTDAKTARSKSIRKNNKETLLNETGWTHEEAQRHLAEHYLGVEEGNKYIEKMDALSKLFGKTPQQAAKELFKDGSDFTRWRSQQAARWDDEIARRKAERGR